MINEVSVVKRISAILVDFILFCALLFVFLQYYKSIGSFLHRNIKWYDTHMPLKHFSEEFLEYDVYYTDGNPNLFKKYLQYAVAHDDTARTVYELNLPEFGKVYCAKILKDSVATYYKYTNEINIVRKKTVTYDIPKKLADHFLNDFRRAKYNPIQSLCYKTANDEYYVNRYLKPFFIQDLKRYGETIKYDKPIIKRFTIQHITPSYAFSISLISFFSIIYFLILLIVYSLMESSKLQGTPGKILLHLKVVDRDGNSISYEKAFIRGLCRYLSILMLFSGYLLIVFRKDHRTLHDIISKTIIVNKLYS